MYQTNFVSMLTEPARDICFDGGNDQNATIGDPGQPGTDPLPKCLLKAFDLLALRLAEDTHHRVAINP